MNLVGHVAAALAPDAEAPSTDFLVGCMLPDLSAIARVRITRPGGELGAGVTFHHRCDAAFHESEWFRSTNRSVRDALVDAGIDSGPARACSHAGVEMLLDGALVDDPTVEAQTRAALDAVTAGDVELGSLAPGDQRDAWVERLHAIGCSLDPIRYRDARFVAQRLHRMTTGRRRIELRPEKVDVVAAALIDFQPAIADAAPDVLRTIRSTVSGAESPTRHHQG
jgi:hypothetical protein